jgi:hypothetical protein
MNGWALALMGCGSMLLGFIAGIMTAIGYVSYRMYTEYVNRLKEEEEFASELFGVNGGVQA